MDPNETAADQDSGLADFTNEDAVENPMPAPESPAPQPEAVAEGTNVKTATAAPAKGKKGKAPKAAKPVKAEAAPKAAKEKGKPGRSSGLEGMKLFKPVLEKIGMQEGSRRMETYKSIRDGMKYETFVEKGGNRSDLARLIFHGRIEARKE